jgi:hypothetical protein
MGYIVNLTVILDGILKTVAGNVTGNTALKVKNSHIMSGRRDRINQDIRSFVTVAAEFPEKDLVLEKIVDLIEFHCSSPQGIS